MHERKLAISYHKRAFTPRSKEKEMTDAIDVYLDTILTPQLEHLGVQTLVSMIVFIVVLALGLVYAWRKGVLRWA